MSEDGSTENLSSHVLLLDNATCFEFSAIKYCCENSDLCDQEWLKNTVVVQLKYAFESLINFENVDKFYLSRRMDFISIATNVLFSSSSEHDSDTNRIAPKVSMVDLSFVVVQTSLAIAGMLKTASTSEAESMNIAYTICANFLIGICKIYTDIPEAMIRVIDFVTRYLLSFRSKEHVQIAYIVFRPYISGLLPAQFSLELANEVVKQRCLERMLADIANLPNNCFAIALDLTACVLSACLAHQYHEEFTMLSGEAAGLPKLHSETAEALLSAMCSFEVNGTLLTTAKDALMTPSIVPTYDRKGCMHGAVFSSLQYLCISRLPLVTPLTCWDIVENMRTLHVAKLYSQYDLHANTVPSDDEVVGVVRSLPKESPMCSENIQVFIDLLPRLMTARQSLRRKRLNEVTSSTSTTLEDPADADEINHSGHATITSLIKIAEDNVEMFIVSTTRFLGSLVIQGVEVRKRLLAKRLPLGGLVYGNIEDMTSRMFNELCKSLVLTTCALTPRSHTNASTEAAKNIDPQLMHICQQGAVFATKRVDCLSDYIMLVTALVLSKEMEKVKILEDCKLLEVIVFALSNRDVLKQHEASGGKGLAMPCRLSIQLLSTIAACCPSMIESLAAQELFYKLMYDILKPRPPYAFVENSHHDVRPSCHEDLILVLQLWSVLFAASDSKVTEAVDAGESIEPALMHVPVRLLWTIFSAIAAYDKMATLESMDACIRLSVMVRMVRAVLCGLGRDKIFGDHLLMTSVNAISQCVKAWLLDDIVKGEVVVNKYVSLWCEVPQKSQFSISFDAFNDSLMVWLRKVGQTPPIVTHERCLNFLAPPYCQAISIDLALQDMITMLLGHAQASEFDKDDVEIRLVLLKEVVSLTCCFCDVSPLSDTHNTSISKRNWHSLFVLLRNTFLASKNSNMQRVVDTFRYLWENIIMVANAIPSKDVENFPSARDRLIVPSAIMVRDWIRIGFSCLLSALDGFVASTDASQERVSPVLIWIHTVTNLLSDVMRSLAVEATRIAIAETRLSTLLLQSYVQLFTRCTFEFIDSHGLQFSIQPQMEKLSDSILVCVYKLCRVKMSSMDMFDVLHIMSLATAHIGGGNASTQPDNSAVSCVFLGNFFSNRTKLLEWGYKVLRCRYATKLNVTSHRKNVAEEEENASEHLTSPAWCTLRTSNVSGSANQLSCIGAVNAFPEASPTLHAVSPSAVSLSRRPAPGNRASFEERTSTSKSPVFHWPPVNTGYSLSIWFSVSETNSSLTTSSEVGSGLAGCSAKYKCVDNTHYVLCRIHGDENAVWPELLIYICRGRLLACVKSCDDWDESLVQVVCFDPLPVISYDNSWHHLVIRHHTNRASRPFIVATLDGTASQEYPLFITATQPNIAQSTSQQSCRGYSISSCVSTSCPMTMRDGGVEEECVLQLGPILLLKKPLSTSQVAALIAAGPYYQGIFHSSGTILPGMEGGEIPLHMAYCSPLLVEAILRSRASAESGRANTMHSVPGILSGNVYTDTEINPENVLFSANGRWIRVGNSSELTSLKDSVSSIDLRPVEGIGEVHGLTGDAMIEDSSVFRKLLTAVTSAHRQWLPSQRGNAKVKSITRTNKSQCMVNGGAMHPLSVQGSAYMTADSSLPATESSASLCNMQFVVCAILHLIEAAASRDELIQALLLLVTLSTSFPSLLIGNTTEFDSLTSVVIGVLRKQSIQNHIDPSLSGILAAIVSFPSSGKKINSIKTLWYGSCDSQDSSEEDDETDVKLSEDMIILAPRLLWQITRECLFQSNLGLNNLKLLLINLQEAALHPLSRYSQTNKRNFENAHVLQHIFLSLCDPRIQRKKLICVCEFIMGMIVSDLCSSEDFEVMMRMLLVICTHSNSLAKKYLETVSMSTAGGTDNLSDKKTGLAQKTNKLNSDVEVESPVESSTSMAYENQVMLQHQALRQSILLMLLQAVCGFTAAYSVGRQSSQSNEDNAVETTNVKKMGSNASDEVSGGGAGKELLVSSLHDATNKSLVTVTAAVPVGQMLYVLNRVLGLRVLGSPELIGTCRPLLINPAATQDVDSAMLSFLLISCTVHSALTWSEMSPALIQQYIVEMELTIPTLFFAILQSVTSHHEATRNNAVTMKPASTVDDAAEFTMTSEKISPEANDRSQLKSASLMHGSRFLDLNADSLPQILSGVGRSNRASSTYSMLHNIHEASQYFPSYSEGIAFLELKNPALWLPRFVEATFDIIFGAPGMSRQHIPELLLGWDISNVEPVYHPPPATSFPVSAQGMCVGLTVLIKSAVEAARYSTSAAMLNVSGACATDPDSFESQYSSESLIEASNQSRATCMTIMCTLLAMLYRSSAFRKYLFQPTMTQVQWNYGSGGKKRDRKKMQRFTLLDVLLIGVKHVFFASAKARLFELLSGSSHPIGTLLGSFEAGLQIPYDMVYMCCSTSICRLCLQIMTHVTVSKDFNVACIPSHSDLQAGCESLFSLSMLERQHVLLAIRTAQRVPDEMSSPPLPEPVARLVSLVFTTASRRRVLHTYHQNALYHSTTDSDKPVLQWGLIDEDADKFRLRCRELFDNITKDTMDIVQLELELSDQSSGSIAEYIDNRIFGPLSMLLELTSFASQHITVLNPPSSEKSVIEEQIAPQQPAPSEPPKTQSRGFGWGFMSNLKDQFKDTAKPTTTQTATAAAASQSPFPVIRFIKSNLLGGLSADKEDEDAHQKESKIIMGCLSTAIRAVRAAATLMLEKLREKSHLRREVFIFMVRYKYYFFRELPTKEVLTAQQRRQSTDKAKQPDRDLDAEFTACLTFYFYQCMLDEDASLQVMSMKCWGELFRSQLGQYASDLLVVQVSQVTAGDVTMRMRIDLWKFERGGLYMLEDLAWSGQSTTPAASTSAKGSRKHSISVPAYTGQEPASSINEDATKEFVIPTEEDMSTDDAYISILQWLDDLSEEIRDAFEEQICESADKLRQEVVSASAEMLRSRSSKWNGYGVQLDKHNKELHTYISQLHAIKRRDVRVLQRMMLSTLRSYNNMWKRDESYQEHMLQHFSSLQQVYSEELLHTTHRGKLISRLPSVPPLPEQTRGLLQSWKSSKKKTLEDNVSLDQHQKSVSSHDTGFGNDKQFLCLENKDVGEAKGDWAVELSEDYCRRRRRIRRGSLKLVPVYVSSNSTQQTEVHAPMNLVAKTSMQDSSGTVSNKLASSIAITCSSETAEATKGESGGFQSATTGIGSETQEGGTRNGLESAQSEQVISDLETVVNEILMGVVEMAIYNCQSLDYEDAIVKESTSRGTVTQVNEVILDASAEVTVQSNRAIEEERSLRDVGDMDSDSSDDELEFLSSQATADTLTPVGTLASEEYQDELMMERGGYDSPVAAADDREEIENSQKDLIAMDATVKTRVTHKKKRAKDVSETLIDHDSSGQGALHAAAVDADIQLVQAGDELLYTCRCQEAMGMDGKKVICGISEMKYLYVFDVESVNSSGTHFGSEVASVRKQILDWKSSASHRGDYDVETADISTSCLRGGWSTVGEGRNIGPRVRYWPLHALHSVHVRRYLLLPKAIEIFITGGKSLLFRFDKVESATQFLQELAMNCVHIPHKGGISPSTFTRPNQHVYDDGSLSPFESVATLASVAASKKRQFAKSVHSSMFMEDSLRACRDSWVDGKLSNFEYLMHLNTFAGRSFNDWGQYPVFPWVLRDYESETLDLTNPAVFRDLSKPMGALTELRRKEAEDKYINLSQSSNMAFDDSDMMAPNPEKASFLAMLRDAKANVNTYMQDNSSRPFHYGTHYSTSAIVLHYLVRLQPFSGHAVLFQGDRFDHADRLFQSIRQSWMSASGGLSSNPSTQTSNMQDVKELIPEFFYLPEFLCNMNKYDFGSTPAGVVVDDVELPPWANGSPTLFIQKHRAALESEYVSRHLHLWIDLIFGSKQSGAEAVKATNIFKFLSYANDIDITAVENEAQRASYIAEICNFGQTPDQLFKKKHPPRRVYNGRDISGTSSGNSVQDSMIAHGEATVSVGGSIASQSAADVSLGSKDNLLDIIDDENDATVSPQHPQSPGPIGSDALSDDVCTEETSRMSVTFSCDEGEVRSKASECQSPFLFEVDMVGSHIHSTKPISKLLRNQCVRFMPHLPVKQTRSVFADGMADTLYYEGKKDAEVVGLHIVDGDIVGIPHGTLFLPAPGKHRIVLAYGFIDCTFKVLIRSSAAPADKKTLKAKSKLASPLPPPPLPTPSIVRIPESSRAVNDEVSTAGKLLRGFGTRPSEAIDHSPYNTIHTDTVSSQYIPIDRHESDGQEFAGIKDESNPWQILTSVDIAGANVSCAAVAGRADADRVIVVTGHSQLNIVQLWSVDTQALAQAAADKLYLLWTSSPNHAFTAPSQAFTLLQSYHSSWHPEACMISIAACLNRDRLLASCGVFASCNSKNEVVLWDFCYSTDGVSIQPIDGTYRGVHVYPIESTNHIQECGKNGESDCKTASESDSCTHITFDASTSDMYVTTTSQVIVFDVNSRVKATASLGQWLNSPISLCNDALCTSVLRVHEWECFRIFLTGYRDGSVCLWAMQHHRDTNFSSIHSSDTMLPPSYSPANCTGGSCVPSAELFSSFTDEEVIDGYDKLMLLVRSKWEAEEFNAQHTTTATAHVLCVWGGLQEVPVEYVCYPVMRVCDSSGGNQIPITSVRMSPDWSCIMAGRANGSVISWKVLS